MWLIDRKPEDKSPEYKAWYRMSYTYGDQVCDTWRWYKGVSDNRERYETFRACVGPRPAGHVLIRLEKSLPFAAGNVRWGTHNENSKLRGPMRKFSYARDNELIDELERRGYNVKCILARRAA